MSKTTIYIGGMHCSSCEYLIKNELMAVPGVSNVQIDHRKQDVVLHHRNSLNFDQLKEKIEELGYHFALEPIKVRRPSAGNVKDWFYAVLIVLILFFVYKVFRFFGFLDWLTVTDGRTNGVMAFFIGIVASLSTCLAIVGAVVLSLASKYQSRGGFFQSSVRPHLLFHSGRLATFFILGGLLGVIGGWLKFTPAFSGWLMVFVAIVLVSLGLNILGILPSISARWLRLPKKTLKFWDRVKESEHNYAPLLLGAITFFLPCGFTQGMQILAAASGSFWSGGIIMLAFAVGTLPVLFGLGVAASYFSELKLTVFRLVIGMAVVIFGISTLLTGWTLKDLNLSSFASATNQNINIDRSVGQVQEIRMTVDYSGYSPSVFKLRKGVPVKWIIDVKKLTGCNSVIVSNQLGIQKNLQLGENVIEFTPEQSGTIGFSCSMGMIRGKFVVSD